LGTAETNNNGQLEHLKYSTGENPMTANWKRDMATIAGGLAVGIIGSRLLAPIVATANGALRGRRGHDPFELLIQDHREISSLLQAMEAAPPDATMRRTTLFLRFKRALAKHALAEEDVVYPLLYGQVHAQEASKHLYDEHADMKIHLYELDQLLKDKADWRGRVADLRDLIEGHIRQEEDLEFPKLRQALRDKASGHIASQIHREEALIL